MKNRLADTHVHLSSTDYSLQEKFFSTLHSLGVTDVTVNALTYRYVIYNIMCLYWKHKATGINVSVFGMPNFYDKYYKDIPYEVQAKALMDMGCDGIKLMFAASTRKEVGYGIDDKCLDKMFDYLEQNNIPITVHTPDPDGFWDLSKITPENVALGRVYDHTYPTKQQLYDEAFKRLDKNPNLSITFAHFFFTHYVYESAVEAMEKYPNIRFDLTPGSKMYLFFSERPELWHDFFEKYGDRILYGTDAGPQKRENPLLYEFVTTAITHDYSDVFIKSHGGHIIKGLNLSEETQRKIMFENYDRIIGEPSKVDTESLKNYASRVYDDIKDDVELTAEKEWLELFFAEM